METTLLVDDVKLSPKIDTHSTYEVVLKNKQTYKMSDKTSLKDWPNCVYVYKASLVDWRL